MPRRFLHVRRSSLPSREKLDANPVLVGVPHSRNSMDFLKRPGSSGRRSTDKIVKADPGPDQPARMELVVESPPLVCYGLPNQSSGALFSGQLKMHVLELSVLLEKFEVQLLCTVTCKKPVVAHCPDCVKQVQELHKWEFLKEPTKYKHGEHAFPISHLLPGKIPATTQGITTRIEYSIVAKATTSMGQVITLEHPLKVLRAIQPGTEKLSVRLFPPTSMAMSVTFPPVIHPIGEFNVQMNLSGITTKRDDFQYRWKIRKMTWRIEEQEKAVAPACPKHVQKVGSETKVITHDETRAIAEKDLKGNWKHDFASGEAMSEFSAAINLNQRPVCDVEGPNELSVSHAFVIELIVTEEYAPMAKQLSPTPTGAARVLRASFNIHVTERAGLGVSWDEEQPPLYEDVPASPPTYAQMSDYDGSDIENDHLHIS